MSTRCLPALYLIHVLSSGVEHGHTYYGAVDTAGKLLFSYCEWKFDFLFVLHSVTNHLYVRASGHEVDGDLGIRVPRSQTLYNLKVSRKSEARFLLAPKFISWEESYESHFR